MKGLGQTFPAQGGRGLAVGNVGLEAEGLTVACLILGGVVKSAEGAPSLRRAESIGRTAKQGAHHRRP